jgi:hypothetical protein
MLPTKPKPSAPEATEAATAAPTPIAGTPTHGYEPRREAAMAAFAKSWRREEANGAKSRLEICIGGADRHGRSRVPSAITVTPGTARRSWRASCRVNSTADITRRANDAARNPSTSTGHSACAGPRRWSDKAAGRSTIGSASAAIIRVCRWLTKCQGSRGSV